MNANQPADKRELAAKTLRELIAVVSISSPEVSEIAPKLFEVIDGWLPKVAPQVDTPPTPKKRQDLDIDILLATSGKSQGYIVLGLDKVDIPDHLRWSIWERDDFRCRYCGSRRFLAVDHIIPESQGGTLDLENLLTACRTCNSRKGTKPLGEFIKRLFSEGNNYFWRREPFHLVLRDHDTGEPICRYEFTIDNPSLILLEGDPEEAWDAFDTFVAAFNTFIEEEAARRKDK